MLAAAFALAAIKSSAPYNVTGASTSMLRRRPYRARLVGQNHAQQRTVNIDVAVVIDKAELTKLVHEMANARARRANHLSQGLLTDLGDNRLGPAGFAEICQQQQHASQPLLG